MAANDHIRRLILLAIAGLCVSAPAETRLSLEQASLRDAPDYAPAYDGKVIAVQGVAATRSVRVLGTTQLLIQDSTGHGLTIEGTEDELGGVRPGDVLDLEGDLHNRAGLPVLHPREIKKIGGVTPPSPLRVGSSELNSFDHLGTLVEIESFIITTGENAGGDVLMVGGPKETPIRVFLPRDNRGSGPPIANFQPGDKVRIVGFSSQYCAMPPYNRSFQLLIPSASAIKVVSRGWIVSPSALIASALITLIALTIWWTRERDLSAQSTKLRAMTALAEDVISADTPSEIAKRVTGILPGITKAYEVGLYLLNRNGSALDRVPTEEEPEPLSISILSPIGSFSAVVALCFRNRTQLHIPNTRKSPFFRGTGLEEIARSALLIPMFAQKNLVGILTLKYRSRMRKMNADEHAAMQHLANQIATSLKLQEQHSMREQLLRSEKMAAAGQLISGVANELRAPLNAIHRLASDLLTSEHALTPHEDELREIAFEAHRGSDIIGRLVSFANADQHEFKALNLIGVVTSLVEFREREWEVKGLRVRNQLPQAVYTVMGNQGQLEQVILNLLVHAEQSVSGLDNRNIDIGATAIGKKLVLTVDYSDSFTAAEDDEADNSSPDALGLQVCRAIMHNHGGQLRLIRDTAMGSRFEVELALQEQSQVRPADAGGARKHAARSLTVLLVEPDAASQRRLLSFLTARGHRAVPVTSAEEAMDMVHRLRFDVVFCAVRLPGLNWVELFEKIRRLVGAFVLVTEGFDADLSRAFKGSDGYLLSKPIEEAEIHKLLASIEARQESVSRK